MLYSDLSAGIDVFPRLIFSLPPPLRDGHQHNNLYGSYFGTKEYHYF